MVGRSYRLYQLGLAVVGFFTLVLVIMLLTQASGVKKDSVTYQKAQEVADKLNTYTQDHNSVPASLEALKVQDMPDTISYTRINNGSYKFCAAYSSTSSNFSGDGISALSGTAFGSLSQPPVSSFDSQYDTSYLYVSSDHKKGDNCQTIKLYTYDLYNNGSSSSDPFTTPGQSGSGSSSGSDPYAACNSIPLNDDAAYNACINKVDAQQQQQPQTFTN